MTVAVRGNSFPIKTFCYKSKLINIYEHGIYCVSPKSVPRLCFDPQKPIIDASILDDGTVIIFDGSLHALKFNGNSFLISCDIELGNFDFQEMRSRGQQILLITYGGSISLYDFKCGELKLKHSWREVNNTGSILAGDILDGDLSFCVKTTLKNLQLIIYSKSVNNRAKIIDAIEITGLYKIQGHLVFDNETNTDFILFDGDSILKISWNKSSKNHKQNLYKIKGKSMNNPVTFIASGEKYMINDYLCPSFIMFTTSSEAFLVVLIEDTLKFWVITCETTQIESAVFSEELCLIFINSQEQSGFYSIDTKNLKISLFTPIETFSVFRDIKISEGLISNNKSLVCLSSNKSAIVALDQGIIPRHKFLTDSIFRGVTKLWMIKKHFQDINHEYLIMSSESYTIAFKIEEYTLTDVTNIMNIERNFGAKIVFNLRNTGYVVLIYEKRIIISDLSKLDSADTEVIKYDYLNSKEPWTIVCSHDFHLFCYARTSKSISIIQLKHRPRDIDLVVLLAEINLESLGIIDFELATLHGYSSENGFQIVFASVSGFIHQIILDLSLKLISKKTVQIGKIVESIEMMDYEKPNEIYTGTRCGDLLQVNFNTLSIAGIEHVSSSPVRLSKFSNNTLMAYSFDSSILVSEDSKECIKRKIINWGTDVAVELIYRLGRNYIAGIKDDSLCLMIMPTISENVLSKRTIFQSTFISAFFSLDSGKWLIGCCNPQEKKTYLKLIDPYGLELYSVDQGSDEIVEILPLDKDQKKIFIVYITKDKLKTKFEIIDVESSRFETRNEYMFEGVVSKVKLSNWFILYSINEEFSVLEVCPFSIKFMNRTSYHFRNTILDFDCLNDMVLMSTFSDGLDLLCISIDSNGSIKLIPSKGDKISRSCLSCIWIDELFFAVSDKHNNIHLCEIADNSRWIKTKRTIKFKELVIRLFNYDSQLYCETISGTIMNISNELEK